MQVKICGLKTPESVAAAVDAGASYLGFVFFPKSPRHLTYRQAAELAAAVPDGVIKVALTVNADDNALAVTSRPAFAALTPISLNAPARPVLPETGLPNISAKGAFPEPIDRITFSLKIRLFESGVALRPRIVAPTRAMAFLKASR